MAKSRYPYTLPTHPVDYGVTLNIADLKIDPQAQRTLNEKRAQTMADTLVPEAVGSIVVSERSDRTRYIVDGMHRARAEELLGMTTIVGEVHHGLTQQEEAVLFLIKNRESNKPQAIDEYKVGLTAGLPLFVDTDRVLRAHGLDIGTTSVNSVGAVAGVLRITDDCGPEVLDRVLTVAENAWGRTSSTWDGVLLGGLGIFFDRHGDLVNDKDLAMKMAKAGTAQQWIGSVHSKASGGGLHNTGTGSRLTTCYAQIVTIWNKGKTKNRIVV